MWNFIKRHRGGLLAAVLLAALLGWLAGRQWLGGAPAPSLITEAVTRGDLEDTVLATGTLRASRLTNVGAQVSGQITKLYVQVGDKVAKGQPIADIDDTTQRSALRAAQDNVTLHKAHRAARQSALALARQNHARQQYMWERDATSQADYQSARQALDAAVADLRAIEAQIAQYTEQARKARADLDYTRIVAPSAGTVVAIVTPEGQTVSAMQSAPTIVKLADLDTMRIEAQISEADVTRVRPGMPAYFSILGEPHVRHEATLRSIEPGPTTLAASEGAGAGSAASGSGAGSAVYYNGLLEVPNPDHSLRIQMTAQVTLVLARAQNALLIPSVALGARAPDGRYAVRVATGPKGRQSLQERRVSIGLNNRVQAQVLDGLQEGEQVVLSEGSGGGRGGPPPGGF